MKEKISEDKANHKIYKTNAPSPRVSCIYAFPSKTMMVVVSLFSMFL